MRILFDYSQKVFSESKVGNYIHSYYLSKYLSEKNEIYGLKASSKPMYIKKETNTIFFTNFFIKKPIIITYLAHFIYSVINHKKIDLIYSRYSYGFKQFGFYYKIFTKKKWIVEVGGIPWEENKKSLINKKFFKKLFLYSLKKADKVIFYSSGIKEGILKEINIDRDKIEIISCGVNEDLFKIIKTDKIIKKHNLDKNKKIIGYVGSIDLWQGLDILIGVCENLIKKNKTNFIFIIVGGGKDLERLKNMVSDKNLNEYFIFTDKIKQDEIPYYINSFDFCVAPFVKERKASPIKIFEYLACGKLVISSDISDVKELGLDSSIIYAKAENLNSFTQAMEKALDIKDYKIYEKSGREMILENYTWKKVSEKVNTLINN